MSTGGCVFVSTTGILFLFFFFQAEDGIRDLTVTGVQTCALPISEYTKKLGLELDLNARGMGMRCQRFSMVVDDGVVKSLNIEGPGKFEVSDEIGRASCRERV